VPFFRVNKRPEFIGLHESGTNTAHSRVEKIAAVAPDSDKQGKNRALVCSGDAGDGAYTHSFKQKINHAGRFFCVGVVPCKGSLAGLGKRRITAGATVTLDSLPSVKSKTFCFVVIATQASHGLLFLREKPYNQSLGFECGVRPRLDSAPLLVQASDGALLLGVPGGDWTLNHPITNRALFQLSYRHHNGASA
jgi:hypothetical protein